MYCCCTYWLSVSSPGLCVLNCCYVDELQSTCSHVSICDMLVDQHQLLVLPVNVDSRINGVPGVGCHAVKLWLCLGRVPVLWKYCRCWGLVDAGDLHFVLPKDLLSYFLICLSLVSGCVDCCVDIILPGLHLFLYITTALPSRELVHITLPVSSMAPSLIHWTWHNMLSLLCVLWICHGVPSICCCHCWLWLSVPLG